jgi:hypothetical protein
MEKQIFENKEIPELKFLSYNQEGGYLLCGFNQGYRIYSIDPIEVFTQRGKLKK